MVLKSPNPCWSYRILPGWALNRLPSLLPGPSSLLWPYWHLDCWKRSLWAPSLSTKTLNLLCLLRKSPVLLPTYCLCLFKAKISGLVCRDTASQTVNRPLYHSTPVPASPSKLWSEFITAQPPGIAYHLPPPQEISLRERAVFHFCSLYFM